MAASRLTVHVGSTQVFTQLIRQWGILYGSTTALGELAFQKAATAVWKKARQEHMRVLRRSGSNVDKQRVPMPSSLFLNYDGFKLGLEILSRDLFPHHADGL